MTKPLFTMTEYTNKRKSIQNFQEGIKLSIKSERQLLRYKVQNQNFYCDTSKTFIHQDLWYGKLVPSSHQRGNPSHTILCTFNIGNNQIWKNIPISDCLREEWTLVNVSSCSWGLKSQWVMISTAPNWGIRWSVEMLTAPFRPLYKRISLLSLLFLRDSNFNFFSSIPVILPVSKQ